jgi:hypothetical protein
MMLGVPICGAFTPAADAVDGVPRLEIAAAPTNAAAAMPAPIQIFL